ncbi:hypothetical protein [Glycomyces harbinensis]|uniref:Secreted protein n=1 Tax=Glycomyces harbinensis TaxID=58114 RepID=A0A1G6ZMN1_9ACTN|nr:hypothetical protein [Glycomyces harbinensis]SDE04054.1 hypothetical protein SAMN05216270_111107 [Glycomyces harbinensis]
MTKRRTISLAGIVLAIAFSLGVQGTAAASDTPAPAPSAVQAADEVGIAGWPTGCSYESWTNGTVASCDASNGGHYRALVRCRSWDSGAIIHRSALNWISSGDSYVFCPPRTSYLSSGIETRST